MEKRNTVGMDMGDKKHSICILDSDGEVIARDTVNNTARALQKYFGSMKPCLIAIEASTHSAWVSRVLEELGHRVLVGNPRKLRVIWDSDEKDDSRDAEMLARIARFDRKLLHPIHHRGKEAQSDLAIIKARDNLIKARSALVSHCRGAVKSVGHRISKCSVEAFPKRLAKEMPSELSDALVPIMDIIEGLTARIRHYDRVIDELCTEKYPETVAIRQIQGVGPITALAFVLTLEDHNRFRNSRCVGPYLGLVPKRDKSGETDKQLRITKAGDAYLRRLLVNCAQYIMGPFGEDCDLRRFGLKLAARGGKNAKKRAMIAVARKVGVLMHYLWKTGEEYRPLIHQSDGQKEVA
jgi:transposase